MPHSNKKILDELKSKGLIYDDDKDALAKRLLDNEIAEGKKKDSVIEKIINQMKSKGLIFLQSVLLFFQIV